MTSRTFLGFIRLTVTGVALLLCFSADATAQGPTVTTLHTFTPSPGEGAHPSLGARLVEARDGSFYGLTRHGGAADLGTIFRITPDGTTTTLHSFTDGLAGLNEYPSLVQARDENFYGVTPDGGSAGQGTIFRMTPDGAFTVLHTFNGTPDGATPLSELLEADGYLYGTTRDGGDAGWGTIFKMSLEGTLTTLHSFMGSPEGAQPQVGLVQGADGNFYGLASSTSCCTTFFRMTPDGTVTVTHFPFFVDGFSLSRLVEGIDGNFYGTGFFPARDNAGMIYRVTPSGAVTVMAAFGGEPTNLSIPPARISLLRASDTYLYGTTIGSCEIKDIPPDPRCFETYYFRMDLKGHVEFLKRFSGTGILNPLIEARDGNLYGTWRGYPGSALELGAVVHMSNYTNCNDKLTVRYEDGTLHLGFTLMTKAPRTWRTWLAVPGPPVQVARLWSVAIPAIEPAVFADVPVSGFPQIGNLFVLTALTTDAGAVCADWKVVNTGP